MVVSRVTDPMTMQVAMVMVVLAWFRRPTRSARDPKQRTWRLKSWWLVLMVGSAVAGAAVSPPLVLVGPVGSWAASLWRRRKATRVRQRAVVSGVSDLVELFVTAIGAGLTVRLAIEAVAPRAPDVFVDGLRGLGAMGIATYHIWRYEPPVDASLPPTYLSVQFVPWIVDWALLRAWFGVQFLLVVSGFVIAYSLRNTWVTPREIISFVGRRIVRLWPPFRVGAPADCGTY